MKETLETKLEKKDSWMKRAFKEEWPTMGNHLLSAGIATAAAMGFSHYASENMDSNAAIAGATTAVDVLCYWGTFLPQLMYRDRDEMKDEEGNFDRAKIKKKVVGYAGFVGATEVVYATSRSLTQFGLQEIGWDPESATLAIQLGATGLFTFAYPPMRYAIKEMGKKKTISQ